MVGCKKPLPVIVAVLKRYAWCDIRQQSSEEPCDETSFGKKATLSLIHPRNKAHPRSSSGGWHLGEWHQLGVRVLVSWNFHPMKFHQKFRYLKWRNPHLCKRYGYGRYGYGNPDPLKQPNTRYFRKPSKLGTWTLWFKGQLGVPLTVYPWYLLCSLGIFQLSPDWWKLAWAPEPIIVGIQFVVPRNGPIQLPFRMWRRCKNVRYDFGGPSWWMAWCFLFGWRKRL